MAFADCRVAHIGNSPVIIETEIVCVFQLSNHGIIVELLQTDIYRCVHRVCLIFAYHHRLVCTYNLYFSRVNISNIVFNEIHIFIVVIFNPSRVKSLLYGNQVILHRHVLRQTAGTGVLRGGNPLALLAIEGGGQGADSAVTVQHLDIYVLDDSAVVAGEVGKEGEVFWLSLTCLIPVGPILVREVIV